jgi:hypothetical protein
MNRAVLPHLVIFLICFGILAGSLILSPPDEESPFIKIGNIPLPGMCTFRSLTGIPCPGCGLFRSLVTAAHGNLAKSFEYHRLGPVTIVYVLLQFIFRLGFLLFPVLAIRHSRADAYLNRGLVLLAGLFALNWIFTLVELL